MSATPVKMLNIFDLQLENKVNIPIQEIINYCELRFRSILTIFGRSEEASQLLIQRGLHNELVLNVSSIHFFI